MLGILDFLFHNHQNFSMLRVENLITTSFSIIVDLIQLDEMEILDGKLIKILNKVLSIESGLLKSHFKEMQKTESAFLRAESSFLKTKSPQSPKFSQFFKPSERYSSPTLQKSPKNKNIAKSNENSKKFMKMLGFIKFLMDPLLIFLKYRETCVIKEQKLSFQDNIFKEKSIFSHEKHSLIYKKYCFLQKKPLENLLFFEEKLLLYCKKQVFRWQNLQKMKEISKKIEKIHTFLYKIDQEMIICSICGKQIPCKFLKDHSNLCKESDELKEKLKNLFVPLMNCDILWLDQNIRKSKNMIPILKQQIDKLTEEKEQGSYHIIQQIRPLKPLKIMNTCPTFNKKQGFMQKKSNLMMVTDDTEDNVVSVMDIQQTLKRFKAFKKKRELSELVKVKELLEIGKNCCKILFKLNENIRNFRSFFIIVDFLEKIRVLNRTGDHIL